MQAAKMILPIERDGQMFQLWDAFGNVEGSKPSYYIQDSAGTVIGYARSVLEVPDLITDFLINGLRLRWIGHIVKVIQEHYPVGQIDWALSGSAYIQLCGKIIRVADHDLSPRSTFNPDLCLYPGCTVIEIKEAIDKIIKNTI